MERARRLLWGAADPLAGEMRGLDFHAFRHSVRRDMAAAGVVREPNADDLRYLAGAPACGLAQHKTKTCVPAFALACGAAASAALLPPEPRARPRPHPRRAHTLPGRGGRIPGGA